MAHALKLVFLHSTHLVDGSDDRFRTMGKLTYDEVAKHSSADDCWIILYGKVYDLTEFIPEHPGGPQILSLIHI